MTKKREGPLLLSQLVCDGCSYHKGAPDTYGRDSGLIYSCHFESPRLIPGGNITPSWCPLQKEKP